MNSKECVCGCGKFFQPISGQVYFNEYHDPHYAVKVRSRADKYGKKKKLGPEDREDFASYAVEYFLRSGRHNMEWLYIDWQRYTNGDLRSKNVRNQLREISLEPEIIDKFLANSPTEEKPDQSILLQAMQNISAPRIKAIAELYLLGLENGKIAKLLRIENCSVAHAMRIIKLECAKVLSQKAIQICDSLPMEIQWITI
jgi:hypothetical protein